MTIKSTAILMAAVLATPAVTLAGSLDPYIRIGDADGFGFRDAAGLVNSGIPGVEYSRTWANADKAGILGVGDRLPDLNKDGVLAALHGDDFDNRSASENNDGGDSYEGYSCTWKSCTVTGGRGGTRGQRFTDISLSMSYDFYNGTHEKSIPGAPPSIYNHNTGTWGEGGEFPGATPSSAKTPQSNQPGFIFDFWVDLNEVDPGKQMIFDLVFADYDVVPAHVGVYNVDEGDPDICDFACLELSVKKQTVDGEIQSAFVALPFDIVFGGQGPKYNPEAGEEQYHGTLAVNFIDISPHEGVDENGIRKIFDPGRKEPYTAFDYVELSQRSIPLPSSLLLILIGLAGLAYRRTKTA